MKKSSGYLVAEFPVSSGVHVPLLSDEECKARGIDRPKLPPFETWSPKQQAAGQKLGEVLTTMAVKQAYWAVLRHLEAMQVEGYAKEDFEREAARRALAELRAGKWKASREAVSGLEDALGWTLKSLLNGDAEVKPRSRRRSPTSKRA